MKNNIKQKFLLIVILSVTITNIIAQQPSNTKAEPQNFEQKRADRKEKMDALRVGFLTQELQLSTAEAEKFWPVFNQFQNEMRATRLENMPKGKRNENVTPEQSAAMADKILINKQKILDIEKKYHSQFKEILGPEKLAKLYLAERKFKEKVMQNLRERRNKKDDLPRKGMEKPERD
jgi:hypothetical protein